MNGRVFDIYEKTNTNYAYGTLGKQQDVGQAERTTFDDETTKGIMGTTEVSKLFFSSLNIEALQHGIRFGVYSRTNGERVIGNQSVEELKVIMRSIYLQYSENLPYEIVEQVRDLNTRVLNYAIPTIVKELEIYNTYRRDQASLPVPLERSMSTTIKGSKQSELKSYM